MFYFYFFYLFYLYWFLFNSKLNRFLHYFTFLFYYSFIFILLLLFFNFLVFLWFFRVSWTRFMFLMIFFPLFTFFWNVHLVIWLNFKYFNNRDNYLLPAAIFSRIFLKILYFHNLVINFLLSWWRLLLWRKRRDYLFTWPNA